MSTSSVSNSGTATIRPIEDDTLKLIGRVSVVLALIFSIIAFIDTSIIFHDYYTSTVTIEGIPETTESTAREFQSYFEDLGISSAIFAWYIHTWRFIKLIIFYAVALLIFSRRSDSVIGIIISLWLIGMGAAISDAVVLAEISLVAGFNQVVVPALSMDYLGFISINVAYAVAWFLLAPALLIYPNGKMQPRWSWISLILVQIVVSFWLFLPEDSIYHPVQWNSLISTLVYIPTWGLLMFVIFQRYRKYFSQVERQQTKIFIYLTVIYFAISTAHSIFASTGVRTPYASESIIGDAIGIIIDTSFMVVPIAVGIALFRYRLWDIDLVINRSLVYGAILAIGAIVFGGALFSLQLLGSTNPILAAVIALVVTALLYNPARKRVQSFVDHRIYGLRFGLDEVNQLKAVSKPTIETSGQLTGQQFGDFELLDLLGKGGMGEVYKAYRNGETVAIKVLNIDMSTDPEMRRRFEREAAAGMKLEHPNIVTVHDMKEQDDFYYMVMEHIDGQDLRQYLKLEQKLDIETATTMMSKICDALRLSHEANYVHRDIKPANIMIRTNGDPVLMDFGIAKLRDGRTVITKTGTIGTIDYMAPEQIMEAKEVDARADIYALGVTFYEMLAGERPFTGSPAQVMFAHIQQPPPDLRDVDDEMPRHVAKAIMKALAKKPDERYQSAAEFAADLS